MQKTSIAPKHVTFQGGRGEPFHDWYPYLEGFSPEFVKHLVSDYMPKATLILEPFAGTGTTPVVLSSLGIDCGYCEVNPIMSMLVETKAEIGKLESKLLIELNMQIDELINLLEEKVSKSDPDPTLQKDYKSNFGSSLFFDENAYQQVLKLKTVNNEISAKNQLLGKLMTIAVMSKLVICSKLKRSGDVRYKTEKEMLKGIPSIIKETISQLKLIGNDCLNHLPLSGNITLLSPNSKHLPDLIQADGVITSPPYLNGTNYFRNTKLELWYCNVLAENSLRSFRDQAITSGINDVGNAQGRIIINSTVNNVVKMLSKNAYDMRIPRMVAGYFEDMKNVLERLKANCKVGAPICIDIGDSSYAKVHVPTHDILASIGEDIGLKHIETVKLRKRFSKDKTELSQSLIVLKKEH
jgi:DNA modification methylase